MTKTANPNDRDLSSSFLPPSPTDLKHSTNRASSLLYFAQSSTSIRRGSRELQIYNHLIRLSYLPSLLHLIPPLYTAIKLSTREWSPSFGTAKSFPYFSAFVILYKLLLHTFLVSITNSSTANRGHHGQKARSRGLWSRY